jgi:hypothetical protein
LAGEEKKGLTCFRKTKLGAQNIKVDAQNIKVDAQNIKIDAQNIKIDAQYIKVGVLNTDFKVPQKSFVL